MSRILLLFILICLGKTLSAQHVYTIKADSVKITNNCDTAELIIENHTQNVSGFLFNKGRGRTEFRKGLLKLNDSLYRIGDDTLKIPKPPLITTSAGISMVGNSFQLGSFVQRGGPPFIGQEPWATGGAHDGRGNRFTSDRMIDLNGHILHLYQGGLQLSNFWAGSYDDTLIHIRTRGGVGLSVDNHYGYAGKPLLVSYDSRSVFQIKVEEQRVVTEFSDNVTGSPYLNIRSNNITPGNANNNPYGYGVRGVITLQGRYEPSESDRGGGMVAGIYDTSWYKRTGYGIDYCSYYCAPRIKDGGVIRGILYELVSPSGPISSGQNIAFENRNGDVLLNTLGGEFGGRTGIHTYSPGAWLHLGAGINTVNGAPLRFSAGEILDSPEEGAVEFDGMDYYVTTYEGRYKLSKTLTGQLTTNFGGPSLAAWNSITTSLTIAGAEAGDVVMVSANNGSVNPPSISISAYVTSYDTVTIRAYNSSNSAVTIASDTYKVRVIK